MEQYNFNRNFVHLIKMFNKHPYMFINFLNKNDALTETFKNKLSNAILNDKPNFINIDQMVEYYLHVLDNQDIKIDKIKEWNSKLYKAINEQRFEDAVKIRDYMNKKNYRIFI